MNLPLPQPRFVLHPIDAYGAARKSAAAGACQSEWGHQSVTSRRGLLMLRPASLTALKVLAAKEFGWTAEEEEEEEEQQDAERDGRAASPSAPSKRSSIRVFLQEGLTPQTVGPPTSWGGEIASEESYQLLRDGDVLEVVRMAEAKRVGRKDSVEARKEAAVEKEPLRVASPQLNGKRKRGVESAVEPNVVATPSRVPPAAAAASATTAAAAKPAIPATAAAPSTPAPSSATTATSTFSSASASASSSTLTFSPHNSPMPPLETAAGVRVTSGSYLDSSSSTSSSSAPAPPVPMGSSLSPSSYSSSNPLLHPKVAQHDPSIAARLKYGHVLDQQQHQQHEQNAFMHTLRLHQNAQQALFQQQQQQLLAAQQLAAQQAALATTLPMHSTPPGGAIPRIVTHQQQPATPPAVISPAHANTPPGGHSNGALRSTVATAPAVSHIMATTSAAPVTPPTAPSIVRPQQQRLANTSSPSFNSVRSPTSATTMAPTTPLALAALATPAHVAPSVATSAAATPAAATPVAVHAAAPASISTPSSAASATPATVSAPPATTTTTAAPPAAPVAPSTTTTIPSTPAQATPAAPVPTPSTPTTPAAASAPPPSAAAPSTPASSGKPSSVQVTILSFTPDFKPVSVRAKLKRPFSRVFEAWCSYNHVGPSLYAFYRPSDVTQKSYTLEQLKNDASIYDTLIKPNQRMSDLGWEETDKESEYHIRVKAIGE